MDILTPYAAILGLLYLVLSVRIVRLRNQLRVGIGDGGDQRLGRAIRAHANFAEYVPLLLILLFLMERQHIFPPLVHALALCIVIGRVVHAIGVSQVRENLRYRVAGMVLTFIPLAVSAGYLLVHRVVGIFP